MMVLLMKRVVTTRMGEDTDVSACSNSLSSYILTFSEIGSKR
jgi:hypothetical protein